MVLVSMSCDCHVMLSECYWMLVLVSHDGSVNIMWLSYDG